MKKGSAEVFCGSSLEILFLFFFSCNIVSPKRRKKKSGEKELASAADRTCWQESEYATGKNQIILRNTV